MRENLRVRCRGRQGHRGLRAPSWNPGLVGVGGDPCPCWPVLGAGRSDTRSLVARLPSEPSRAGGTAHQDGLTAGSATSMGTERWQPQASAPWTAGCGSPVCPSWARLQGRDLDAPLAPPSACVLLIMAQPPHLCNGNSASGLPGTRNSSLLVTLPRTCPRLRRSSLRVSRNHCTALPASASHTSSFQSGSCSFLGILTRGAQVVPSSPSNSALFTTSLIPEAAGRSQRRCSARSQATTCPQEVPPASHHSLSCCSRCSWPWKLAGSCDCFSELMPSRPPPCCTCCCCSLALLQALTGSNDFRLSGRGSAGALGELAGRGIPCIPGCSRGTICSKGLGSPVLESGSS